MYKSFLTTVGSKSQAIKCCESSLSVLYDYQPSTFKRKKDEIAT